MYNDFIRYEHISIYKRHIRLIKNYLNSLKRKVPLLQNNLII